MPGPGLEGERRILVARGEDLVREVMRQQQPVAGDFYDPGQQKFLERHLYLPPDVELTWEGGYPEAERKRMVVYPAWFPFAGWTVPLVFLQIEGNFRFYPVTHRDFLGALLGLGIKREKAGDILLVPGGCQVILAPEVAEYVRANLDRVGKVPVKVKEIGREDLNPAGGGGKEVEVVVSSLRLDAVLAAGFGLSRSEAAALIAAGRVRHNWEEVNKGSGKVEEDDVISCRGFGRLRVKEILGETRKGRVRVNLIKYG